MFAFLYNVPLLRPVLMHDYSKEIRPFYNAIDDWLFKHYNEAGCYGPGWGLDLKEPHKGVLVVNVVKGKEIPHWPQTSSNSQYVLVRVASTHVHSMPVVNNTGEPCFRTESHFAKDLYTNTLMELSLYSDGKYRDTLVGRVTIPVKELLDVRVYHGWLMLEDGRGDPAGFVYVSTEFRTPQDKNYADFEEKYNSCMKDEGDNVGYQMALIKKGRSIDRAKNRLHYQKPSGGKKDDPPNEKGNDESQTTAAAPEGNSSAVHIERPAGNTKSKFERACDSVLNIAKRKDDTLPR
ncbi:hypothetical protein GGF46_001044 [Coemansia sp. RSA 552]|nr:hypothetical protein GGF46_001044 [Coemansia sp. RSA 552]